MQRSPIPWQIATVERIIVETPRVKTFSLSLPAWPGFIAGQHVDVRLTAPDGYQSRRNYSIASAPKTEGVIDLTIELIPDGEISPYFHRVVTVGDQIAIRGPIGGPFTWSHRQGGPLLLIAAGAGIAPIMSMLRHRHANGVGAPAALLYSSRSWDEVIYRGEIAEMSAEDDSLTVLHTLTRTRPEGWAGYARRIDAEMVENAITHIGEIGLAYICGSDGFVEMAANLLVDRGTDPTRVHTERFGPSGQ